MSKVVRIIVVALTLAALAMLWELAGPLTALAIFLTLCAYLAVLALKSAAEEIQRFEREQRPDLHT